MLLAVLACFACVSAGCSDGGKTEQNDLSAAEFSFSKDILASDINYTGEAAMLDGNLYFLAKSDGKYYISGITQSGEETGRVPIEPIGLPSQLVATAELFAFLDVDFEHPNNNQSCLRFISKEDESERSYPLSSIIPDYSYGSGIILREYGGVFYLEYSRAVTLCDSYGKVQGNIDLDSEVIDMQIDDDGKIYTLTYNRALECYSKKGVSDKKDYKSVNALYGSRLYISGSELYILSDDKLYSYNTESEKIALLTLWSDAGIYAPYISAIFGTDDGFIVQGRDAIDGISCFWRLEPIDKADRAERTVIEVSYLEDGSNSIPLAAVKFNSAQSEYKVECREYHTGSSPVSDYDMDLISGKLGDIFIMPNNTDYGKYVERGAFVDLYELIDRDPAMSRDDIYSCVLESFETDGKLYVITPEFKLGTLTAKAENLPDGKWDINTLLTFESKLGEETTLIGGLDRLSMMKILLSCGADEFIDFEKKTASFDSELFIGLLEYLKGIPANGKQSDDVKLYRENKVILSDECISNLIEYLMIYSKYGFDSEVEIVGYPSASGGVCRVIPRVYCGISSYSENVDGAWEFVKFMMSGANLLDDTKGMQNIPALRKTLYDWLDVEGSLYYYFSDETGRYKGSESPITDEKMLKSGRVIHPDEKLFSEFDTFINSASAKPELPSKIMEMIKEESEPYFAGIKSAKETARIIQDRVSVYVSETM